jgi:hypothetical protein
LSSRRDSGITSGPGVWKTQRFRGTTELCQSFGIIGRIRRPVQDQLSEKRGGRRTPPTATMGRIEEGLDISMTGLLAPVAIGLLC